jgi:hypothetical protein
MYIFDYNKDFSYVFCCFFETGSCYIAQVYLGLAMKPKLALNSIILTQLPEDCRHVPSGSAIEALKNREKNIPSRVMT